jgi:alpha-D-ribose 1-methylphosphonate 5-triphosphate diphosphatase PhnM
MATPLVLVDNNALVAVVVATTMSIAAHATGGITTLYAAIAVGQAKNAATTMSIVTLATCGKQPRAATPLVLDDNNALVVVVVATTMSIAAHATGGITTLYAAIAVGQAKNAATTMSIVTLATCGKQPRAATKKALGMSGSVTVGCPPPN